MRNDLLRIVSFWLFQALANANPHTKLRFSLRFVKETHDQIHMKITLIFIIARLTTISNVDRLELTEDRVFADRIVEFSIDTFVQTSFYLRCSDEEISEVHLFCLSLHCHSFLPVFTFSFRRTLRLSFYFTQTTYFFKSKNNFTFQNYSAKEMEIRSQVALNVEMWFMIWKVSLSHTKKWKKEQLFAELVWQ